MWRTAIIGIRPFTIFQRRENEGLSWDDGKDMNKKRIQRSTSLSTYQFSLAATRRSVSALMPQSALGMPVSSHLSWVFQNPTDVSFVTELRCLPFVQIQWLHKLQKGRNQLCTTLLWSRMIVCLAARLTKSSSSVFSIRLHWSRYSLIWAVFPGIYSGSSTQQMLTRAIRIWDKQLLYYIQF